MRLKTFAAMICVLATACLAGAQSKPKPDALSGTWTGHMGPNDTEQQSITITIKTDGKAISGLITGPPYPGDITGGSFDPATGALRLDVTVRNDEKTTVVFEGKVVKGTATGTVAFQDRKGTFTISRSGTGQSGTVTPPGKPPASTSKQPAKRTAEELEALFQAHKGDFDYLLGDWAFTARSKEYDKFRGYWSAIKLEEGQVLDEYRVAGDNGETYYVTTTIRNYNKFADRWELVGADAGGGLQDYGTGRRVGNEVHIEQRFGVASGTASTLRIRYFNIKPDSFSWAADRSTDGGKTWVKDFQTIEARRIGPPRTLGPLAPARKGS